MVDTILCIDCGTTSLKAALLSDKYTVEAYSKQDFDAPGADAWFRALCRAVRELKEKNPDAGIEAVCVSGNGPTLVLDGGLECGDGKNRTLLWNENPVPPRPMPQVVAESHSMFIPRLWLLREMFPDDWKRAHHIFSGPEYLIFALTGTPLSILPDARYRPAYWNCDELLRSGFGEDDVQKLPPFVGMGEFAGKVSAKSAIATGLFEGTFVFCGAPDFIVALIGTGTLFPGMVCDRAGSSEGINLCTSEPLFAPGVRTLPHPVPGLWNASVIIEKSGTRRLESEAGKNAVLSDFAQGVGVLRDAAREKKIPFSNALVMTGGQCRDESWIRQKALRAGVRIDVPWCSDGELIGDLILARVALGDFDDIQEAAMCLCKVKKSYGNI